MNEASNSVHLLSAGVTEASVKTLFSVLFIMYCLVLLENCKYLWKLIDFAGQIMNFIAVMS